MKLQAFDASIIRSIYRNKKNYFTIALARIDNHVETIIGFFPIFNEGLVINCHGKKEKGRNKDEQYRVESYSIELPKTDYNLYHFLTNDFIEMNLNLASEVMEKVGVSYLDKYSHVDYLKEKLGKEIYEKNKSKLFNAKHTLDAVKIKLENMETLIQMGFANELAAKVAFSEFKTNSKSLKSNPYQLIFPFDLTWKLVDEIALKNGININSQLRIEEGIVYLLDEAVQKHAHIYLPRNELLNKLTKLVQISMDVPEFKTYENKLSKEERLYCDVETHLYGYRYFKAEQQLSKDLHRLNGGEVEEDLVVTEFLKNIEAEEMKFSDEQKEAIFKSLKHPLLIISGAAGTGKTTVLKKIIDMLDNQKNKGKNPNDPNWYKIKLCAPTGRASERLKEVTGREAQTIHSLLNHNQLTKLPEYSDTNKMDFDCYVVDESSMNDTILFSQLLNAIESGSKVIIVGDEDQLPSIGPGNVLYELLHNSPFEKVRLTRVYRQGEESAILDLATSIREGNAEISQILKKKTADFSFIYNQDISAISDIAIKTVEMLLDKPDFDYYTDFQIVTPIHKTDIGTIALNARIQELMNSKTKNRKSISLGNKIFYTGDKVINTTNNKEKKVFNGEIGKVISIVNKTLYVLYGSEKEISYTNDELFDLELAHATTVHKMQGSEASIILFPVHSCFGVMLQRKLLYTGVTRAKRKLLLVGQPQAISKAISVDNAEKRNCNLKQRLVESELTQLFK